MRIVEQYLLQLNTKRHRFRRSVVVLTVLSLLVILTVSWNLRQTGVTIANDACCGYKEHQHTEECLTEKVLICTSETITTAPDDGSTTVPIAEPTEAPTETPAEAPTEVPAETPTETPTETPEEIPTEEIVVTELAEEAPASTAAEHIHSDACYETVWLCDLEEHVHELTCYSDLTADLEDWNIWNASIPELTGNISQDIVLVAQSQLGIQESTLNFELADDGETQNGITRYGQWYGNPYGPWSNMFTSFCLRFAGISNVPINSGAAKMQMEWENLNLYRHAGGYEPMAGDIVFLDKNQNGTPEATGVVVKYFDFILTVIEGDVENAVVQQEYHIEDPVISGYGMTNAANRVAMFAVNNNNAKADSPLTIGTKQSYTNASTYLGSGGTFILYATGSDNKTYAIDGNGNAVEIQINDTTGAITANVSNVEMLYWTVTKDSNNETYTIRNVATRNYLYLSSNNTLSTQSRNLYLSNSSGYSNVNIYSNSNNTNRYLTLSGTTFTRSSNGSSIYFVKAPAQVTLWLDGTNGGLMSYIGSENRTYLSWKNTPVYSGVAVRVPTDTEWAHPTKYQYKLAGWVNIRTGEYYAPGSNITITANTVLYADWIPATYDIGQNENAVRTSSTSDFITTYVFDYTSLINLYSTKLASSSSVNANSHSESWGVVTTDQDATFAGQKSLYFSFVDDDWNDNSYNNKLDDPSGRSEKTQNAWTGSDGNPFPGIIGALGTNVRDNKLVQTLFGKDNGYNPETKTGIIGKHDLGTGDHLFQYDQDTGYYYYDATRNAAAYNKSEQRFYIYNYLERTSDSAGNDPVSYSDFLPLNHPTVNTANNTSLSSAVYPNNTGDYKGKTYYTYEARKGDNSPTRAEWWYGMRTDISFGLPDDVGAGNRDINGNEMEFRFTGDDDVWILIDDVLVLDLGGIHLSTTGYINFSTGVVTAKNFKGTVTSTTNLTNYKDQDGKLLFDAGEHTLTILYLERGGSMANCAIYFNLAPRFSIALQKEDVLTQEVLEGAQFGFFLDQACTQPCTLWTSQAAYKNKEQGGHIFTANEAGQTFVWGLSPSQVYYIKEIQSPSGEYYATANGVIRIMLNKSGLNSYGATILPGPDGEITNGFTVHGFRVDEESQTFYLSITNAQNWVTHTTSVYVEKQWNDNKTHTNDSVTVYLQVTDPDGTVRRVREVVLSQENSWKYAWSNLPMYLQDPTTGKEGTIPVVYSVVEKYVSGYQQSTEELQNDSFSFTIWSESLDLTNGGYFLLKTNNDGKYLSAVNNSNKLQMVNEATAKSSNLALWKATVSENNQVTLTNEATKRSINFYNSNGSRYYNNATTSTSSSQVLTKAGSNGIRLSYSVTTGQGANKTTTIYYLSTLNNSNYASATTDPAAALVIYPIQKNTNTSNGSGFRITNTPLASETSLKVTKVWDHPFGDNTSSLDNLRVTFKLYRNGVDTGLTETVDATSNWTAEFKGLPYKDASNNAYKYTVVESWETEDWVPNYGEVETVPSTESGKSPTYQTTVTNRYSWGVELPSTGGIGNLLLILIGLVLISAPFVYGFRMRRRYRKEARR